MPRSAWSPERHALSRARSAAMRARSQARSCSRSWPRRSSPRRAPGGPQSRSAVRSMWGGGPGRRCSGRLGRPRAGRRREVPSSGRRASGRATPARPEHRPARCARATCPLPRGRDHRGRRAAPGRVRGERSGCPHHATRARPATTTTPTDPPTRPARPGSHRADAASARSALRSRDRPWVDPATRVALFRASSHGNQRDGRRLAHPKIITVAMAMT